jgi:peroxiredoxin
MERPGLQALFDAYEDQGFAVVSVSIDQSDIDAIKLYVKEHEITFPNLHDRTSEVSAEYGVRGVPSSFFINAEGKAIGGLVGPRDWDSEDGHRLVEHLLSQMSE